jgi:hypothetical protein
MRRPARLRWAQPHLAAAVVAPNALWLWGVVPLPGSCSLARGWRLAGAGEDVEEKIRERARRLARDEAKRRARMHVIRRSREIREMRERRCAGRRALFGGGRFD